MFNNKTDKKIFAKGGRTTYAKYGNEYMKMIGKHGGDKGGRPLGSKNKTKNLTVDKSVI